MKKTIIGVGLSLVLLAAPASGQMMDDNHMTEEQQNRHGARQAAPNMNPSMMSGYGMMPNMMGYNMMPGMTGHGAGSCMMDGYGMGQPAMDYGMMPNMMGYGMGRHQSMMGGYGMMPNMMGGYGHDRRMMDPESEKQYKELVEKNNRFLDETRELRKKLHTLKFEYHEALRSTPEPDEKLDEMKREMFDLQLKINNKSLEVK